jgi:hypothetical protein
LKNAYTVDTQLRQRMRDDVGGLSAVPTKTEAEVLLLKEGQAAARFASARAYESVTMRKSTRRWTMRAR